MSQRVLTSCLPVAIVAALLVAAPGASAAPESWVAGWGAAQVKLGALSSLVPHYDEAGGLTLRNVVRTSAGGSRARVRVSNLFGERPVTFDSVTIGVSAGGAELVPGSVRRLRFGSRTDVTIPPGETAMSDPVAIATLAGQDLAVSLYSAGPTGPVTADAAGLLHATYIAPQADVTASASAAPFTETVRARYYVAGVDVPASSKASGTLVAIGDSILAGYNSTADKNRGWADLLAKRLYSARSGPRLSLVNTGISGNNLHEDTGCYGQSILTRLKRDAIDVPGVQAVFLSIGANDITHPEEPRDSCLARKRISAAGMIALYKKAIARLHASGIRVYGTTIMPFGRYRFWSPAIEAKRVEINRWIKTSKDYDGVADLGAAIADPADPTRIRPAYDSGDGLHPRDAGHAAMARAIPVSLFDGKRPQARAAATPKPLPRDFEWGVSSSAFQSEGGKLDDNWQLYIERHPDFDPYGKSVDFKNRYRGDVGLAAGLAVNTYRIGVNWARVQPTPGAFDESALRYYDKVVDAMLAKGIKPLLTLDHWDYPRWVFDQGSWTSAKTAKDFVKFATLLAKRYRARVDRWLTFNEAAFYTLAETAYRPLDAAGTAAMTKNLIAAHRGAFDAIHRFNADAQVSSNVAWQKDRARTIDGDAFLQGVKDKLDYVGLDYYYPGYQESDFTFAITGQAWRAQLDPFGMYVALQSFHRAFPKLPVMVTENGMPLENAKPRSDGYRRGQNLRDNVYWMQRARDAGVPVIGYLYWSLTDNYEFGNYTSRFGLYTVDVLEDPSLKRKPTDAVPAYTSVIKGRGVPSGYSLVRKPAATDCKLVPAADRGACVAAAK